MALAHLYRKGGEAGGAVAADAVRTSDRSKGPREDPSAGVRCAHAKKLRGISIREGVSDLRVERPISTKA